MSGAGHATSTAARGVQSASEVGVGAAAPRLGLFLGHSGKREHAWTGCCCAVRWAATSSAASSNESGGVDSYLSTSQLPAVERFSSSPPKTENVLCMQPLTPEEMGGEAAWVEQGGHMSPEVSRKHSHSLWERTHML